MKVLYRPHRMCGTLEDSMADLKEFNTVEKMLDHIVKEDGGMLLKENIYISYYTFDDRINWETYIVAIGECFGVDYLQKYKCPQVIGFMTFKY